MGLYIYMTIVEFSRLQNAKKHDIFLIIGEKVREKHYICTSKTCLL